MKVNELRSSNREALCIVFVKLQSTVHCTGVTTNHCALRSWKHKALWIVLVKAQSLCIALVKTQSTVNYVRENTEYCARENTTFEQFCWAMLSAHLEKDWLKCLVIHGITKHLANFIMIEGFGWTILVNELSRIACR